MTEDEQIEQISDYIIQSNAELFRKIMKEDFEAAANIKEQIDNTLQYFAEIMIQKFNIKNKEDKLFIQNQTYQNLQLENQRVYQKILNEFNAN